MCRTYYVCCYTCKEELILPSLNAKPGESSRKTFYCPSFPNCGMDYDPIRVIDYSYCFPCLEDQLLFPATLNAYTYPDIDEQDKESVQRVLNLAPEETEARIFSNEMFGTVLVDGAKQHFYDSHNVRQFLGELGIRHGVWLFMVVWHLEQFLLDPMVPDLTDAQYRLFVQLRVAMITHRMNLAEDREVRRERKIIEDATGVSLPGPGVLPVPWWIVLLKAAWDDGPI